VTPPTGSPRSTHTLGVDGTRLTLDGRHFPLTGVSFFNALYNPTFNRGAADRERWLRTFLDWGVNTLRVWCQWDFAPPRTFIDTASDHSLYADDGSLREHHVQTLLDLCAATDALGMALEVTLFSHHDMFQYGYDSPLTPPSGIPEPDWSPFHRVVFEHLRATKAW